MSSNPQNSPTGAGPATADGRGRTGGAQSLGWGNDSELWRVYGEECQERLASIDRDLEGLEENPFDPQSLACLVRAFHTIKAGSSLLEARLLAQSAHELESLLNWFRVNRVPVSRLVLEEVRSGSVSLKRLLSRTLPHLLESGGCSVESRASPVALDRLFRRFVPSVESTARRLGKAARLQVQAMDLAAEAGVERALNQAMPHLLLNAIVHGIEPPEQRIATNKSACGIVSVSARQEENQLAIEVADDGRGICHAKIIAAAVQRGLVLWQAAIAEQAALDLIFEPGLSTVPVVSELAGRGVGLDVVRCSLAEAGGSIRVTSHPGKGTTFMIRIPGGSAPVA